MLFHRLDSRAIIASLVSLTVAHGNLSFRLELEVAMRLFAIAAAIAVLLLSDMAVAQSERHLPPEDRSPAYKAGLRVAKRKGVVRLHCYARVFKQRAHQNSRGRWVTSGRSFAIEMFSECGVS
ncbi:hypothetical protein [Bosea sp. PAMC 26642]|uniref:hypothetical protein n=1 Tax=Bosea sp. (strain PAMC 26642) TaxID=1792307 RepID=UPI000770220E|nr:hypothetical protein [Bosea sp. PAMC 26642]AMJ61860.1 hypothetical protein AXW83_17520 [Bosea sp. PAMC 26642]